MSEALWQSCQDLLKLRLSRQQYFSWILPLKAEREGDTLVLLAPSAFVCQRLQQQLREELLFCLKESSTESLQLDIRFHAPGSGAGDAAAPSLPPDVVVAQSRPDKASKKPAALPEGLNQRYTFERLVEGSSNRMALASARHICDYPGQNQYNPLLIYGGVGLGKTHLMHAVGHGWVQRHPEKRVMVLPSDRFVEDVISSLRHRNVDAFKNLYRGADLLLVDDIQFFVGKSTCQEIFFHIFNALVDSQRQVVLTCDRYPKEIKGLEERLISRLCWGMTVNVEPPETETRVAILMRKAAEEGIELPQDIAFYIAQLIRSHVRDLEGALKRVTARARFSGKELTMELTREALRDLRESQARMTSVENIQRVTAEYYNIRVADLLSKRRTRIYSHPRQMAMALCKDLTDHSYPKIADYFGGRDHSTVLYACQQVNKRVDQSSQTKQDYQNLRRLLIG